MHALALCVIMSSNDLVVLWTILIGCVINHEVKLNLLHDLWLASFCFGTGASLGIASCQHCCSRGKYCVRVEMRYQFSNRNDSELWFLAWKSAHQPQMLAHLSIHVVGRVSVMSDCVKKDNLFSSSESIPEDLGRQK